MESFKETRYYKVKGESMSRRLICVYMEHAVSLLSADL